nr:ABC transporter permease [Planosporangium thailandense]
MKLRLTGNSLRGQAWRIVLVVFGAIAGLWGALGGFALFTAGGVARGDGGLVIVAFAGAGLTLAWLLLPLLFFGVDETIDPARFALLPVSRGTLLRGMVAAACVSIPAIATAIALLGLIFGAAVRGRTPAAVVTAAVGAVLGLFTCVVGSRALSSAFASMLRSRRVRDLAAILLAVLASSVAPLQLTVSSLIAHGNLARAAGIARVLAWTPLGAPYAAYLDVADGRPATALARLALGLVTLVALTAWWWRTLESAMIGVASGARSAGSAGRPASAADGLFPAVLRWLRPGRFSGLVAREWRYWWREPRRRASLISLTIAGVVVPAMLRAGSGSGGAPLPVAVAFSALLAAMVLANQFGTDGAAYALHLLVGVPGRVELRARACALAALMAPVLVLVTVVIALLTGAQSQVPAALGVVAAALGMSAGISALVSVLVPYAFPESSNPFAVSGGTGGLRGLLALAGSLVAAALLAPVLVFAVLADGAWAGPAVLATGVGWGAAGLLIGTQVAGGILDRRGPEILVAVTPRR